MAGVTTGLIIGTNAAIVLHHTQNIKSTKKNETFNVSNTQNANSLPNIVGTTSYNPSELFEGSPAITGEFTYTYSEGDKSLTVSSFSPADNTTWDSLTLKGSGTVEGHNYTSLKLSNTVGGPGIWNGKTSQITGDWTIETGVTINDNYGTFAGCTGLTGITFPDDWTTLNTWDYSDAPTTYGMFQGCTLLNQVHLPKSLTTLGMEVSKNDCGEFYGCTSLENINLPESLTAIGHGCFYGCTNLKSVYIPNSVDTLGYNTSTPTEYHNGQIFYGCSSLASVHLPENKDFTVLPTGCFENCTSLKTLDIPDTVSTINWDCFKNCSGLTSVKLPNNPDFWYIQDSLFLNCSSLTSIDIPSTVTKMDSYCFYNCGLTSVTLGSNIDVVGAFTFAACNELTSVTIDGISIIGASVFGDCPKLDTISFRCPVKPHWVASSNFIDTDWLDNTDTHNIKFIVPASQLEGYTAGITSSGWYVQKFMSDIESYPDGSGNDYDALLGITLGLSIGLGISLIGVTVGWICMSVQWRKKETI